MTRRPTRPAKPEKKAAFRRNAAFFVHSAGLEQPVQQVADLRVLEKRRLRAEGAAHTAMLGDKLLTDCLAAKRAGVLALTVEPVGGAVTLWQRVLHAMQAPFKAACRRRMAKKVKK